MESNIDNFIKNIDRAERIQALEIEIHNLNVDIEIKKTELYGLKQAIPAGYELVKAGEVIAKGALAFEPYHAKWGPAYNAVGHKVNDEGYEPIYTHRGYKFANPIN